MLTESCREAMDRDRWVQHSSTFVIGARFFDGATDFSRGLWQAATPAVMQAAGLCASIGRWSTVPQTALRAAQIRPSSIQTYRLSDPRTVAPMKINFRNVSVDLESVFAALWLYTKSDEAQCFVHGMDTNNSARYQIGTDYFRNSL